MLKRIIDVSLKNKFIVLLTIIVAVTLTLRAFKAIPVQTMKARRGALVAELMGTGTLEARVKTTISPRIQERLAEVLVDQGDSVKAGQLLARLDDGELKQQVEVATATVAAARASLLPSLHPAAEATETRSFTTHRGFADGGQDDPFNTT